MSTTLVTRTVGSAGAFGLSAGEQGEVAFEDAVRLADARRPEPTFADEPADRLGVEMQAVRGLLGSEEWLGHKFPIRTHKYIFRLDIG
jgi:hypothetical protein